MGGDGNYYQTDMTKSSLVNPASDFEYGKDVFTKEQIVKEDVIKRHIPVDLILGMDIEDMHMGSILPRQKMNRPLTGSYTTGKRAGSAVPTKNSTNFRPSNQVANQNPGSLEPLRLKKSQALANQSV